MSRLIPLLLTATLLFACASTPDLPPLPEVSAAPPAGAVERRELPKTASELPAMGLTGAASLLAAWGVRTLRRRIF